MAIGDSAEIKVVQALILPEAVETLNVFYFETQFQSDQAEEDVVAILQDWIEVLYATIDDAVSDTCTMGLMKAYRLLSFQPTVWDPFGEATPAVTLAGISEMLPHGVAALVRAYTTRAKTIGRKYFPGFTEDTQEDGGWDAQALTALAAAAVQWGNTAAIDIDNRLVPTVFSTVTGFMYELRDEFVVPAFPGYQRRRRPGVGS